VHLAEVLGDEIGAAREEPHAEHDVSLKTSGDPEQRDEQCEQQHGEANVVLAPRIASEKPHAARMGMSVRGGTMSLGPTRWVGVDNNSRLEAKYDAKKKARRIFAISTGWNEIGPITTHRRAPLIFSPTWGTSGTASRQWRR